MIPTCPWCGARKSGLGIHSDPDGELKFTCSEMHPKFGRLCRMRPVHGPMEYFPTLMLRLGKQMLAEWRADFEFLSGTQWPQGGVKIGDTIHVPTPARYLVA